MDQSRCFVAQTWLSCFVVLFCRFVAVAIFPMMTQAADPALAMKRVRKDRSCESEGNMLHLCWNMLFWRFIVYCCRFQWNGFPWIWLVDCWTCLWDCSCFIVDGLENNTKVLVLLSWWIIPQKGVRSNFEILRKCVSQNLSKSWAQLARSLVFVRS